MCSNLGKRRNKHQALADGVTGWRSEVNKEEVTPPPSDICRATFLYLPIKTASGNRRASNPTIKIYFLSFYQDLYLDPFDFKPKTANMQIKLFLGLFLATFAAAGVVVVPDGCSSGLIPRAPGDLNARVYLPFPITEPMLTCSIGSLCMFFSIFYYWLQLLDNRDTNTILII